VEYYILQVNYLFFTYLIRLNIPLPQMKTFCKANYAVNVMLHRVRNNFFVLKVKFPLCTTRTSFLTLALDGNEWLPSLLGCFIPEKKPQLQIGQETLWTKAPVLMVWKKKSLPMPGTES
jgi:hypothetical protein